MPELVVPARAWCDQPGIAGKIPKVPAGTFGVSNEPLTIRFGAAPAVPAPASRAPPPIDTPATAAATPPRKARTAPPSRDRVHHADSPTLPHQHAPCPTSQRARRALL